MNFENVYSGKRVLVTGHTGFKGSWLCIWLHKLGAKVYGYSLPPVNQEDNFVTCNLSRYIEHNEGDVRNRQAMESLFREIQPEFAFHLAAQPLVLKSYSNPVETFETNLMGVVNFFETVRKTPSVKAAINITSDKCYQNHEWVWGYRETDPMGGKDPYSASKGAAELITTSYLSSFFESHYCSIASARAGNVIGAGDWATDRIVPDYFRAIIKGDPVVIRNPNSTRPWQHVLEPLSGYLTLGMHLYKFGKLYSGGWNFGPDGNNYTVEELLKAMININKQGKYEIIGEKNKIHEANFLKLDISKSATILKWHPVLTFQETVEFTVDGYLSDITKTKESLENRLEQIKKYTEKARIKNIKWSLYGDTEN